MKKTHKFRFGQSVLIILLVFSMIIMVSAKKQSIREKQKPDKSQVQTVGPVQVLTSVKNDLSLPLSELAKTYVPPARTSVPKVYPLKPYPFKSLIREMPFVIDPSLQDWQGSRGTSNVLLSFDGVQIGDNTGGGGAPSDQNGDVGPNHYVQMANAVYEIFDKTGTTLLGPANINTLWAGFGGPCQNFNSGDPVVLYDQLADRWFLSQFAVGDPNNQSICVACSQTPDPTGAYYRYQFNFGTDFPDYPKFGVWDDAYSATYRIFPNAGGFDERAGALERNAMLAGNPAQMVNFSISNLITDAGADGFLPGDLDGPIPLAWAIPILGAQDDGLTGAPNDRLAWFELDPDWNNIANSTFTGPNFLPTNPFDATFTTDIPQPGTAQGLDILPHFTMFRLAARQLNGAPYLSMVANHTVDVGTNHAGIRWYELRNSGAGWSIFQQGTYAPDNDNRWMGSIAMDGAGNIALGYSVSSSTTFPAIRFTGHTAGAAAGVMDVAEESIFEGTGSQTSPNRWGDYSMMTVDPTDDATFWYTNQYYATTSSFNWKTRIGSVQLGAGVTPSGILVWEGALGGQDYSGAYINNYLTNAGLTTTYTDVFPTSLIGYDAVFLSFGNYGLAGSNTVFDNTMAAAVEAYLNAGGKVYLEGGDALGYDQSGNTTLLNLFGLSGAADGVTGPTPITALAGQPGTLTAGMLFNASTQVNNYYIDTYTAGGGMIAFNEPTVGDVAAQYDGGGSKTFCFSYALAGLTDGTAPSTKDDLMAAIVNFLGLITAPAPAQPGVIYASTGGNGANPASLLTIDPSTGTGTLIGASGLNGLPGLAINSSGDIYATERGLSSNLYRIDAATGAPLLVGNTGVDYMDAIAFDQSDVLYGIDNGTGSLWTIAPSTGVATAVGPTGDLLAGMAFDPTNGTLYGSGAGVGTQPDGIYTVDKATGAATLIGLTGLGTSTPDLVFDAAGNLYGCKSNAAGPSNFFSIDKATGAGTAIGSVGIEKVSGMASYGGVSDFIIGSVTCPDSVRMGDPFTADVKIDMSNMSPPNENLGSFTATLTWDPTMLSYTGNSGILSGFTGIVNVDAPNGTMTFNGANPFGATGVVDILNVDFDAIGPEGSNTCLNLQFSAMAAAFTFIDLLPFLQPIPPCCLDITPPCTAGFLGDVNGDNAVNSTDALIILSYDAGIPLPQPILDRIMIGFGDVNADGFTNSTDALLIISYDVGIPVPFPVGDPVCLPMTAPGKSETSIGKAEKNIAAFLKTNSAIVRGKTIDVPVTIDMSRTSEELGSYTVTLQWDPAQLQFQSYSGGSTEGFSNPVVNDARIADGKLVAAHAYPYGADGQVNILNLRFKVIGKVDAITNDEISMDFSAMAAAKTFTDLLPYLEVGDAELASVTPAKYSIDNYPNPFNPTTTIGFTLPEASQTRLQIYNIRGQLVRTLVSSNLEAGYHKVEWDGKNENGVKVASGVYIYQIHAGNFVQTKKMIMMK